MSDLELLRALAEHLAATRLEPSRPGPLPPLRGIEPAEVLVDSASDPASLGTRAPTSERQVVLTGGGATVVLDIDGRHADVTIRGQVDPAEPVAAVQLVDGDHEVALTTSDPRGHFELLGVPRRAVDMVIVAPTADVAFTLDLR